VNVLKSKVRAEQGTHATEEGVQPLGQLLPWHLHGTQQQSTATQQSYKLCLLWTHRQACPLGECSHFQAVAVCASLRVWTATMVYTSDARHAYALDQVRSILVGMATPRVYTSNANGADSQQLYIFPNAFLLRRTTPLLRI